MFRVFGPISNIWSVSQTTLKAACLNDTVYWFSRIIQTNALSFMHLVIYLNEKTHFFYLTCVHARLAVYLHSGFLIWKLSHNPNLSDQNKKQFFSMPLIKENKPLFWGFSRQNFGRKVHFLWTWFYKNRKLYSVLQVQPAKQKTLHDKSTLLFKTKFLF